MGMKPISAYSTGRNNNFNLLRMLAAIGVLISHAYPVSLGKDAVQPLQGLLDGITMGRVCVYLFFVISGFFITKSFVQSASLRRFLIARALRLFPALIVVLCVTTLVAGTVLTSAEPAAFWYEVPGYIWRNATLYPMDYDLPGVFEDNPWPKTINGSLWTLFYEVICYVGVLLGGVLGLLTRQWVYLAAFLVAVGLYITAPWLPLSHGVRPLIDLGLPFVTGSAFYVWRRILPLSPVVAVVLAASAILVHGTAAFQPVFIIALSYGVFVVGYWNSAILLHYNRIGDYSYGIYIYAFPIQQILVWSGIVNPLVNIAIALPLTLACAIASWVFVEKPALKLKPIATPTLGRNVEAPRLGNPIKGNLE